MKKIVKTAKKITVCFNYFLRKLSDVLSDVGLIKYTDCTVINSYYVTPNFTTKKNN